MDFIAVVGGMPSPRKVFALLLLSILVLSVRSQAQYAGQVTVLDSSGPWVFLCTATPPAGGGGTFYFDLPDLEPDGIPDPDFSESELCDDGCSWNWDLMDGAVKGLTVILPLSATETGQVATVEGWPIIDNIDLKMPWPSPGALPDDWRIQMSEHGIKISFGGLPDQVATLRVVDLQGRAHHRQSVHTASKPTVELPLPSGVYVIVLQLCDRSLFRKVWVH